MIKKYLNTVFLGLSVIIGLALSIPAATTIYRSGSLFDFVLYLVMSMLFVGTLFLSLAVFFGFITDSDKNSRYMSLGSAISFVIYLLYFGSDPDLIFPQSLKEWHETIFRFSLVTWIGSIFIGTVLMEIKSKTTRKERP